jgi:hypothetical protein
VRHPGTFTDKVIFRRCPAFGERNIVRDCDLTCALCIRPAHPVERDVGLINTDQQLPAGSSSSWHG